MLEPMLDDMTDYFCQGALIGTTALIYMQQSDTCNGRKVKLFVSIWLQLLVKSIKAALKNGSYSFNGDY